MLQFFFQSQTECGRRDGFNEAMKYLLSTVALLGRSNIRRNDKSMDFPSLETDDPKRLAGNCEG